MMHFDKLTCTSVGVDDAHEHLDPGIRKGDRVGADLSRPSPIYRPQWLFRNPDEKALFAPTMQTRQNML